MSKVIFFNIPAQGHINPSLPVVRELVRRGEAVICVNAEQIRETIESAGSAFHPYPTLPSDVPQIQAVMEQASSGNLVDNALSLMRICEGLLPFVLDLLRQEKPDYVLHDSLASWGKLGAQALGIPYAASFSTFVPIPGEMPPMNMKLMAGLAAQILPRLPTAWQISRRVKQKFGVRGLSLLSALQTTGQINIVYTSAEFQPDSKKLGPTFRFVGPSISARPEPSDFPFDQLTSHPVTYISLGTINNMKTDFYRQCFAAFADHPGQFVLSAGKRTDLNELGKIPPNFIVRNFVPQLDVLQHVDVFVTHGGMNSVHEGLWYGVPLVVIPQQVEQAGNAALVVKQGAGVAVGDHPPLGRVTTESLRAAVDKVLANREAYRAQAVRLGETFRVAGGYERAAEELIAFGKH